MTEDTRMKIFHIEKMTIDLFEFWLNYELPEILESIYTLQPPIKSTQKGWEAYLRSRRILWKDSERNYLTNIVWAQLDTDTVHVEFTNEGRLADVLTSWLEGRLGARTPINKPERLRKAPTQELTRTEAQVATWLADRKNYEQIAILLGNKSVAAAKKHAQGIAKKWDIRQVLEILWDEAIRRGYATTL
jgi:DNA-binding CsgD family transcriptional regulator